MAKERKRLQYLAEKAEREKKRAERDLILMIEKGECERDDY